MEAMVTMVQSHRTTQDIVMTLDLITLQVETIPTVANQATTLVTTPTMVQDQPTTPVTTTKQTVLSQTITLETMEQTALSQTILKATMVPMETTTTAIANATRVFKVAIVSTSLLMRR